MHTVEIRVKESIDEDWSAWFAGLSLTRTGDGETVLSGAVVDQAALYGVLTMLRDLGLHLISVTSQEGGC